MFVYMKCECVYLVCVCVCALFQTIGNNNFEQNK